MDKKTVAISADLLDRIEYLVGLLGGYETHLVNGGSLTPEIVRNSDWARNQLTDCAIGIFEEISLPPIQPQTIHKVSGKIH
ncbi:hypothetical protein MO867_16890 [Microbulbifer sp. OS29]|uniref:Uncharacterized protein n=1 Tax=Microbulbifer okhotskensis TaxID=2926617 RepID=A0A9X2EQK3_9GAMM|nr:hypothetical protein [Microbulbifer okhotskensis]MCO1336009.1 hypothetical protein [Microbulbifer okhotskensis]